MKRKDDARDILWFLNKKKPMPAAESERSERGIEKENQVAVSEEQCVCNLHCVMTLGVFALCVT